MNCSKITTHNDTTSVKGTPKGHPNTHPGTCRSLVKIGGL